MRLKIREIFLLVTVLSSTSVFARAKCDMRILNASSITLNESSLNNDPRPITFQSVKPSYGSFFYCFRNSYGFSRGNSSSYDRYLENSNGDKVSYNLYNGSGAILEEVDRARGNDSNVLTQWMISPNRAYNSSLEFRFSVDPGAIFPAGVYTDSINVELHSNIPSNLPELEDTTVLNFSLVIPEEIALSLVTSTTFDEYATTYLMDFGELEKNKTMGVNLIAKSNTGYKILASSVNRGKLKHEIENDTIAYTFRFDGKKANLKKNGDTQLIRETSMTPLSGVVYPLEVKIGNVPNTAESGTYTDSIRFTIESI